MRLPPFDGVLSFAVGVAVAVAAVRWATPIRERLVPLLRVTEVARRNLDPSVYVIHAAPPPAGAGAAEGAMDASNMIKPPLARGELHRWVHHHRLATVAARPAADEPRKCARILSNRRSRNPADCRDRDLINHKWRAVAET